MNQDWLVIAAAITTFSMAAFMVVVYLWTQKFRKSVTLAITDAAEQQVRTAEKLADAIAQVQSRQMHNEQQIQVLAQAGLKLRHELSTVAKYLENGQVESVRGDQTLH